MTLGDFVSNKLLILSVTIITVITVVSYVYLQSTGHSTATEMGVRYLANAFNSLAVLVGLGSVAIKAKAAATISAEAAAANTVVVQSIKNDTTKVLSGAAEVATANTVAVTANTAAVQSIKEDTSKTLNGAMDAKIQAAVLKALEMHAANQFRH